MFGYIVTNKKDLSEEENKLYKRSYCGLCKSLSENYGRIGATMLSYDMTFLNMLLEDLYNVEPEEKEGRCHIHPVNLKYRQSRFSEYSAHMQIILSIFALKDKEKDEGKRTIALSALEKKEEALRLDYPRQYNSVKECIEKLDKLEEENCQDPLLMSQIASDLLSEIFVPDENDIFADSLRRLGISLGRYIYLLDAYDDLEKDKKKNAYNPFREMEKAADFRDKVRELLQDCATEAALVLEKLPLDENLVILRNIIYSGMWTGFEKKESKN